MTFITFKWVFYLCQETASRKCVSGILGKVWIIFYTTLLLVSFFKMDILYFVCTTETAATSPLVYGTMSIELILLLSKWCTWVENWVNKLNPGQHLFEWKFSLEKGYVYQLFNQKRVDIAITKSVFTHFRVFYQNHVVLHFSVLTL